MNLCHLSMSFIYLCFLLMLLSIGMICVLCVGKMCLICDNFIHFQYDSNFKNSPVCQLHHFRYMEEIFPVLYPGTNDFQFPT